MLKLQPQDRGPHVALTLMLPNRLHARLVADAEAIDSEKEYVVLALLDRELTPYKNTEKAEPAVKPKTGRKYYHDENGVRVTT